MRADGGSVSQAGHSVKQRVEFRAVLAMSPKNCIGGGFFSMISIAYATSCLLLLQAR